MHRQLDFFSCFFSKKFDSLLLFKSPSTATGPTPSSTAVVTPSSTVDVMSEGPSTLITAISAGIGGILLVCVLVAVTVVAAVVHARRRKRREEEKKADVPVLQVPPPISSREGISSPR